MTSGEREITGSSPDGLPPLREVIRAFGLEAKKSLGQNFILDLNLTRRIARAAGSLEGRTVVEVGPGPGGLTRALLIEGAQRVIAVERDERARGALEMIGERYPGKLDVHFGDALEANWPALLGPASGRAIIVANLPYGVATLLLTGWLDTEPWPPWYERMVLMFQKEVAERVVAFHRVRLYRFTRDLVKKLRRTHFLLAISQSPYEVVAPFAKSLGFDKVYAQVYEVGRNVRFTGRVLYEDIIANKAEVLRRAVRKEGLTLTGSVGVGDTESDIPFLEMVAKPVCFNPNSKLYRYAKRMKWNVVVERKDVVYEL